MSEQFIIRLAEESDMKAVFELSNDVLVRKNSIRSEHIEWKNHINWFHNILNNDDVLFYVAETTEGEFVGQVRFQKQNNEWVVSISICEKFRGKKVGEYILKQAMNYSGLKRISAYVKKENFASVNLFKKEGYKEVVSANVPQNGLLKFVSVFEDDENNS